MFLKHSYWYFDSVIPKEVCEKFISIGENKILEENNKGASTEASTMGNTQYSDKIKLSPANELTIQDLVKNNIKEEEIYNRKSQIVWLDENWMYDLILPYLDVANKSAGWNWSLTNTEKIQFTKYTEDGFYGWHKDGGSDIHGCYKRYLYGITEKPFCVDDSLPPLYTTVNDYVGKCRKISMTINITDPVDYEGGELKFDLGNHTQNRILTANQARKQGSIVVFPSFLDHCVTPVTRGTRYSLVLWSLGEPWK